MAQDFIDGDNKQLKLTKPLLSSNMNLFDEKGEIKKYESADSILKAFIGYRLPFYETRKGELARCSNKCRYIKGVLDGSITLGSDRSTTLAELEEKGFTRFPMDNDPGGPSSYDYLLHVTVADMIVENREALFAQEHKLELEVQNMEILIQRRGWTS